MLTALSTGRTGLHANQYKLDALSNEIANVNTVGYKRDRISFQELIQNTDTSIGTKASTNKTDFTQGSLQQTHNKWDFAISGEGYFGITDNQGNQFLTRNGAFHLTENGDIVDDNGNGLFIEYTGVTGYSLEDLQVNPEGILSSTINGEVVEVGFIPLYKAENPQALIKLGNGLFFVNGDEEILNSFDNPQEFGKIESGFLEMSNSELTQAMTDMIVTQRAYSLNAQTIRSTDDIMRLITEIKR